MSDSVEPEDVSASEFYRANGVVVTTDEIVFGADRYPASEVYGVTISRRDPRGMRLWAAFTTGLVFASLLFNLINAPTEYSVVLLLLMITLIVAHEVRQFSTQRWLHLHASNARVFLSPPMTPAHAEILSQAIQTMLDARKKASASQRAT
jgi:hypothetical protein